MFKENRTIGFKLGEFVRNNTPDFKNYLPDPGSTIGKIAYALSPVTPGDMDTKSLHSVETASKYNKQHSEASSSMIGRPIANIAHRIADNVDSVIDGGKRLVGEIMTTTSTLVSNVVSLPILLADQVLRIPRLAMRFGLIVADESRAITTVKSGNFIRRITEGFNTKVQNIFGLQSTPAYA